MTRAGADGLIVSNTTTSRDGVPQAANLPGGVSGAPLRARATAMISRLARSTRGNLPIIEHVVGACLALFPSFSRLKLLRTWGGVMDMTMDGSPIITTLPVKGLTMTGGWCYGGFKATPASGWLHAYTMARGEPHALNAAFTLERFAQGRVIDEKGAGPYPWAH